MGFTTIELSYAYRTQTDWKKLGQQIQVTIALLLQCFYVNRKICHLKKQTYELFQLIWKQKFSFLSCGAPRTYSTMYEELTLSGNKISQWTYFSLVCDLASG